MADPLHLHLLSDSTGETLEVIAKACLAQMPNWATMAQKMRIWIQPLRVIIVAFVRTAQAERERR